MLTLIKVVYLFVKVHENLVNQSWATARLISYVFSLFFPLQRCLFCLSCLILKGAPTANKSSQQPLTWTEKPLIIPPPHSIVLQSQEKKHVFAKTCILKLEFGLQVLVNFYPGSSQVWVLVECVKRNLWGNSNFVSNTSLLQASLSRKMRWNSTKGQEYWLGLINFGFSVELRIPWRY